MCGITGIINSNYISPNDVIIARKISKMSKHRGPDESGEFIGKKVN